MSDFVWLDVPLHKNKFKGIDFDELTTVQMSFDGAIMAVKRELVEAHYIESDVQMIKAGYKKTYLWSCRKSCSSNQYSIDLAYKNES